MSKKYSSRLQAQIVIAVHSQDRPISRAVQSVLLNEGVGVIVVAHNVAPEKLSLPQSDRIEIVECSRGASHPGVPYNAGIAAASAPLVGIMGSDDWYEAGAIETMIARANSDGADIVIAPLQLDGLPKSYNPRTLHRRNLRAYRDRLFYRTAPLGLYRRQILQDPQFAFVESVVTGDDLLPSVRLWTGGYQVSSYPDDPPYIVGGDAVERVTTKPRPLEDNLAFIQEFFTKEGKPKAKLSTKEMTALAIKLLRVHILAQVKTRLQENTLSEGDYKAALRTAKLVVTAAPDSVKSLSRSDLRLLRALRSGKQDDPAEAIKPSLSIPVLKRDIPRAADLFRHDSELRQWLTVQIMKLRAK